MSNPSRTLEDGLSTALPLIICTLPQNGLLTAFQAGHEFPSAVSAHVILPF